MQNGEKCRVFKTKEQRLFLESRAKKRGEENVECNVDNNSVLAEGH